MPDFKAVLRQHLSHAKLPVDVEEELAAHLADVYEAEIARGSDECKALIAVRAQLGDPNQLLRAVRRYKGDSMRSFRRHILLPGLVGTFITALGGSIINWMVVPSHVWFFGPTTPWGRAGYIAISLPLVIFYLVAGFFAAYISMRLGGTTRQRLWAALIPALAPLLIFIPNLVSVIIAYSTRGNFYPHAIRNMCWTMGSYVAGFVVLPSIALLVGAAPWLARKSPSALVHS